MPVILYEDTSQKGKMQGFDLGTLFASRSQLGKVGNDSASSVTEKKGYRVLVCPDEIIGDGRANKCEELTAGKHNLKQKDAASYVKVWKEEK